MSLMLKRGWLGEGESGKLKGESLKRKAECGKLKGVS